MVTALALGAYLTIKNRAKLLAIGDNIINAPTNTYVASKNINRIIDKRVEALSTLGMNEEQKANFSRSKKIREIQKNNIKIKKSKNSNDIKLLSEENKKLHSEINAIKLSNLERKVKTEQNNILTGTAGITSIANQIKLTTILSKKIDKLTEQYSKESDYGTKTTIAKEVLDLEAKKEKISPVSLTATATNTTFVAPKSKLSINLSKKEYAKLVGDYIALKKGIEKKFSLVDKEVEKNKIAIDMIKKAFDQFKYVEDTSSSLGGGMLAGGLAAGLAATLRKIIGVKFLEKFFVKYGLPIIGKTLKYAKVGGMYGTVIGAIGEILMHQYENSDDSAASSFIDTMKKDNKYDLNTAAQYRITTGFMTQQNKDMSIMDASDTTSDIFYNLDTKDWTAAVSLAKVRTFANPDFQEGDNAGIYGFNSQNSDVLAAIKAINPKIGSGRNDLRDFLEDTKNSTLVLKSLSARYGSIQEFMNKSNMFSQEEKNKFLTEINYHGALVKNTAKTIAHEALTSATNTGISTGGIFNNMFGTDIGSVIDRPSSAVLASKNVEIINPEKYFVPIGNIDMKGLTADTRSQFYSMAQDYYKTTGNKLRVVSAYRTKEQQAKLFQDDPNNAAALSAHEAGVALDVYIGKVKIGVANPKLLDKWGFYIPVSFFNRTDERHHIEIKNNVFRFKLKSNKNGSVLEPTTLAEKKAVIDKHQLSLKNNSSGNSLDTAINKTADDETDLNPTNISKKDVAEINNIVKKSGAENVANLIDNGQSTNNKLLVDKINESIIPDFPAYKDKYTPENKTNSVGASSTKSTVKPLIKGM
jgi:hypothetical protein